MAKLLPFAGDKQLIPWTMRGVLLVLGWLLWLGTGQGAPGVAPLDAEPADNYHVTPSNGPWMICTASYMGETAPKLAHDLVLEIRQRYNLPAFTYNRGAEERAKQQKDLEEQRQRQQQYLRQMGYGTDLPMRHRVVRIEEQYAVLIGGYKDIKSANEALKAIKKLEAPQSVPKDTYSLGSEAAATDPKQLRHETVNPFKTSFVVRNPTVPAEETKADPADYAFLKKINADENFNLLACKRPWTLAVKVFNGAVITQEQSTAEKIMDTLLGKNTGVQLDAAGQNAHNLAEAMHKMGFETYVLHTRNCSVVSVGSFDRQDDPRMEGIQKALVGNVSVGTDKTQAGLQQQLQLMSPPLPMPVPQP